MPEDRIRSGADEALAVALGHINAGRLAEAESICRDLVSANPGYAQASHLLGAVALQAGDADGAIDHCRRAIASDPALAKAHSNLGAALMIKGQADEAVAALRAAIELDPKLVSARVNLGDALNRLKRCDEAVTTLRQAISLDPANPLAQINLGAALVKLDRPDEAIAVLGRTVEQNPRLAEAHYNLGQALQKTGEYEKALLAFQRVRDLNPAWADNYINLGLSYRVLARYDEAIAAYGEAIALEPDFTEAAFFRSLVSLGLGRFEEGWRDYVKRSSALASKRPLDRTPLAADLTGVGLFLRKDQGLGDEIFFLRFAPELKRRGARLTVQASDKIASLLRRLPFLDAVVNEDPMPEEASRVILVSDLPFLLGMKSASDIPASLSLPPAPDRLAARKTALAALGSPPYIGVTWRAGTEHMNTLFKSAPLERIGGVLRHTRGTLLALQRLPRADEIAALSQAAGRPVHDLTAFNEDLEDMLALVSLLDDYVTVSNTNVHLGAATAKSSRVLVPRPAEFRWMTEGSTSPWFPECPVYRQESDGSWDAAFARLASDLARCYGSRTL